MAGLVPSRDAFAFRNCWPSQPALTIRTPFGKVPIGDAAGGLCGGMVFAVLDYWHVRGVPPSRRPQPGEPLYGFIVRRLMDSWHVPAGLLRYYRWMLAPDGVHAVDVLRRRVVLDRGLARRTIAEQWPVVRDELDAGIPVALGLVTVRSWDVRRLPFNHQVLACGYRREGVTVTLEVYDPNRGPRDNVTISFRDDAPHRATAFVHTIGIRHPVRGFFRTAYAPVVPPR